MFTCVSGVTLAVVVVGELDAAVGAPRVTGVGETFIDVPLAALAHVPRGADAVVASDSIHALSFVETFGLFSDWVGERVAVVNVDFTVHTWGKYGRGRGTSVRKFRDGFIVICSDQY